MNQLKKKRSEDIICLCPSLPNFYTEQHNVKGAQTERRTEYSVVELGAGCMAGGRLLQHPEKRRGLKLMRDSRQNGSKSTSKKI